MSGDLDGLRVRRQTFVRQGLGYAALVLGLGTLYLGARWVLEPGLVDDSYIFLRYAANWNDGHGLVFNVGERVEGYTSPLWLLALCAVSVMTERIEDMAPLLSGAMGFAMILLFAVGAARLIQGPARILLAAPLSFLATTPAIQYWAWSGMDSALFCLLFFASHLSFTLQLQTAGTMVTSGSLVALAALARMDILVIVPLQVVFILAVHRAKREIAVRKLISYLVPLTLLCLHFVWRWSYYGDWLPHTWYTKANLPLAVLVPKGLRYLHAFSGTYHVEVVVLVLALLLVARPIRQWPIDWIYSLGVLACWTAYVVSVGGDHFAMFRFFLPIFPVGAYFFVQVAREFLQDGRSISSGRICSALALLLILLAYVNLSASRSIQGRTARSEVELARYWAEVGSWIKGQVSPETTLGAAAVGAVPFRSGLRTLDLLGLTDRTIGRFGKTYTEASLGHMRYHTDHVLEQKPGIVLFPPRVDKLAHYSTRDAISKVYAYALFDLVGDPRTLELYEYRTATMPHGEVIEFLQLRAQARR